MYVRPHQQCKANTHAQAQDFYKSSTFFVRPLITGSWVRNLRYGGRNRRLRLDEKKISIFKKYPVGFGRASVFR